MTEGCHQSTIDKDGGCGVECRQCNSDGGLAINSEKGGATGSDNGGPPAAQISPIALGSDIIFSVFGAFIAAQGMLLLYEGVSKRTFSSFFDAPNLSQLLMFVVFLVTIVRLYHGNLIYHRRVYHAYRTHKVNLRRTAFRFLVDFYVTVLELILFVFIAKLQDNLVGFMIAMAMLNGVDLLWQMPVGVFSKGDTLVKDTSLRWAVLDVFGFVLTVGLLGLTWSRGWQTPDGGGVFIAFILFLIFTGAAVVDYFFNARFYFGNWESDAAPTA